MIKLNEIINEVIYRCGFCGLPVNKDGSLIDDIKTNDAADKYLEQHKTNKEILVHGECCVDGMRKNR